MKTNSRHLKLLILALLVAAFTAVMMINVSAEVVASGDFTKGNAKATWTWELEADGTLTIGGTGADGNTDFSYGANWDNAGVANIPWGKTGVIDGLAVKKVIILESTGITNIGSYSLGYLKSMEYLQIPSTVRSMGNAIAASEKLRSVYIAGNEPVDNYIDFSNITNLGSYLSEGGSTGLDLTVELNENLVISNIKKYSDVRWFKNANSLTFKLYKDSSAHTTLQLLADNQNNSETCDENYPSPITFEYIMPYSGTFANEYHTNATWKWALDTDGTLYISGSSANNRTDFYYGASWEKNAVGSGVAKSYYYIPWCTVKQKDSNSTIAALIKKVVIEDDTGLTSLGTYALGYLPNMTEIVIPASITGIGTSCFSTAQSLKTISVRGKTDAGEGIYDLRNIKSISTHAFAGAAMSTKVTEPITVWFGEGVTSLPETSSWNWFYPFGADKNTTNIPNAKMTVGVKFKVYPGTYADKILSPYVERQQSYDASAETPDDSLIDRTNTTNISLEYWGIGGNTKLDYTGYTWSLDEETGVLTISGTSTSTTLGFTNAASWETEKQKNIPWHDHRSKIKKVVIGEDTGITAIQGYVFYGLNNCTAIVMPNTVTDLGEYNIFAGCTVLSSIAYSEDAIEENVYDLRYARTINCQLFEDTAKGKTLTLKVSSGSLPKKIVRWFTPSTTVNFMVFEGSPIDAWLKDVAAGTDSRNASFRFAIGEIGYMSVNDNPLITLSGTDTVNGNYSWALDAETGTLTFTRLKTDWCELYFNNKTTDFTLWLNDWRDDIKHIVVPEFSKYQDADSIYPFSNLPNLETVKWDTKRMMSTGSSKSNAGVFYGCEKLSTFGRSSNFEIGTVDLSGFSLESISTAIYSRNMFYGCKGIEKVVLGNVTYNTGDKAATIVPTVIGSSMFEGCTSLREIDISKVSGLMENAFKGCSSLNCEIYYAGDANITTAFAGCGGIVIKTDTAERARAIASSLSTAGVSAKEAIVSCLIHGGFSVRVDGYNGLRSFYTFVGESSMENAGYTLVEYGSLCGSAVNYSKYTQDFGNASSLLALNGTEFKTPEKIVKTALYIADGYSGEVADKKKVNEDGTVTFTVTVINFAEANYKTDVIMTGYEIWKDEEGNLKVIYSEIENADYKKVSLYKVTLGMLLDRVIDVKAQGTPVYNVIASGKKYDIDTGRNDVEAFIVDHHLSEGKTVAIYRTESDADIELDNLGIDLEILGTVSDFVFDKKISCSLPEIDDYWQEHINAQLATLPEGRSFIAITDTHYPGNAGKSADLMEYVRKVTGIKKVINLGDPYHDGNSYEIAKERLIHSMDTKFFSYFGEDGMYAIGNHDSNLTKARTTGDDNAATYKMDLLLSDKDIYENSFKYVEENGKKNGNVVYDEELLDIIEANKGDIKEFVLDNVAAEDAASYNNMFGDVSYTAEEMYENLVYWAKMHYAYYDHDSKICYIVLNTGGLTVTDFAILNRELWYFHPSQYNFVATMLNEISEKYSDYDVVVAGHMFYDRSVAGETYNKSLFQMLSAFEGGTSISFSASGKNAFSGKLFGCTDGATSKTLSFDFSERSFTGEIICITGHRHIDLDLVSQTKNGKFQTSVAYESVKDDLSNNAILLLLLNQDNVGESNSAEEPNAQKPVKGTITEHSFTIFTITEDNTLVATRIGANSGALQKEYKLGDYDKGWEFTKTDSFRATKQLSAWPKTYEAVISLSESYTGRAGVIFGNYGETNHVNFEINDNGAPRLYLNGASYVFDADVRSTGLTHVAITVENIDKTALTADLKCYINGVLADTISGAAIKADYAISNLRLGGDNRDGNDQYFKGSIKSVAAYDYARSAEQIAADHASFGGGDPLFYYDLSSRKMTEIKDLSGNLFNMVQTVK